MGDENAVSATGLQVTDELVEKLAARVFGLLPRKDPAPNSRPDVTPAVVGNETFVPSVFQSGRFFHFKPQESAFLDALADTRDISAARIKIGVDEAWTERFFSRGEVKEYFSEKFQELAIQAGLTPGWFLHELYKVWAGQKEVNREQMEAIKEIGARVSPKVERVQHEFDDVEFGFICKKASPAGEAA